MTNKEQKLKALEFFKDWSNFLLVTTVAALGWVATKPAEIAISAGFAKVVVCLLSLSTVFAIFTLALIPLVAERITDYTDSIYREVVTFRTFYLFEGKKMTCPLKAVCWPQHLLFILGILVFGVGVCVK